MPWSLRRQVVSNHGIAQSVYVFRGEIFQTFAPAQVWTTKDNTNIYFVFSENDANVWEILPDENIHF